MWFGGGSVVMATVVAAPGQWDFRIDDRGGPCPVEPLRCAIVAN